MKNNKYKNKIAFTLAEVLITLGIIGVVAALTIPTLISNIQGIQFRSKFKKTISVLSQAGRLSLSKYDFDYGGVVDQCGTDPISENPEYTRSVCALLNTTLQRATFYPKVTDIKLKDGTNYKFTATRSADKDVAKNPQNSIAYVLTDGTIIMFKKTFGKTPCILPVGMAMQETYDDATGTIMANCYGFIDVNGVNGPNKEVDCSSGDNDLSKNNCVVSNDPKYLTDIYPIRFHDSIVEPMTAAARYVLHTSK